MKPRIQTTAMNLYRNKTNHKYNDLDFNVNNNESDRIKIIEVKNFRIRPNKESRLSIKQKTNERVLRVNI